MRRLVLTLLVAINAPAADVTAAVRTTFVEPWIAAARKENPAQLVRFLHPKVRACINDQTRDFFDFDLSNLKEVTPQHHITKLAPWNDPGGPLFGLPADAFSYPVQPTYEMNLSALNSDTVFVLYLAKVGDAWFMVAPCPNEKGMAVYRDMIAVKKARDERIARLAAELKDDPLRPEYRELIKGGQIVDAAEKYQKTKGLENVFIAIDVLKTIDQ
jgi:hypothetical protein